MTEKVQVFNAAPTIMWTTCSSLHHHNPNPLCKSAEAGKVSPALRLRWGSYLRGVGVTTAKRLNLWIHHPPSLRWLLIAGGQMARERGSLTGLIQDINSGSTSLVSLRGDTQPELRSALPVSGTSAAPACLVCRCLLRPLPQHKHS